MVISDFQPLVNQSFKIVFSDQELPLMLIDVESVGKPYKEGARQPFSLMFVADATDGVLRQGVYPVEHATLGKKDIFLIPRGVEKNQCLYEAVYN
ncbi:MAG: hypothetical protein KZQ88_15650 [Candidatus Thiodiazotropha sp. (ex Dulcina madagascariensis)]|nr:hypothetical protein [Candidatus Thiodiazotropha sp. (ex Epidulcina cf. delphinae)]MCU7924124.1 hypothetical protein [Candidatus Thiodiazotropha sp. (ex Dulcina madagascariensis)]MCU7928775.1 hypothetical protein [Candidatus Thiodiazotropha sp. (ex Dulcina madagascariensis)]